MVVCPGSYPLAVGEAPLDRRTHAALQLVIRLVSELGTRLVDRAGNRLVHLAEHVKFLMVKPDALQSCVDDARSFPDDGGKADLRSLAVEAERLEDFGHGRDDLVDRVRARIRDP